MSSKCDKNGKVTHNAQPSVSLYESFKFLKPMPCPHGRANTRIKSINLSDIFSLFMYLRLILSNSANTRKRSDIVHHCELFFSLYTTVTPPHASS